MKYLRGFVVGLLTMSILGATALAGGSSSNGGGGISKESPYKPFPGLGELISKGTGIGYQSQLRDFIKDHPNVAIRTCPESSKLQYPELSQDMKNRFSFELLGQKTLLEKIGLRKFKTPEPFSVEKLCSESDLVEAYGNFIQLLFSTHQFDEVGNHLISKIFEKGDRIPLVITSQTKKFEALGGEIEEFTWFDNETGKIFWAKQELCKGLACITERNGHSYLRHELTHLLLYRVLGSDYPKEKVWHDIRFINSDSPDKVYEEQTSQAAAFIEGLANAMENGTSFHHPHVLGRWGSNHLRNNCWRMHGMKFISGQFTPPLESETYVSSTINALFYKWHTQDWVLRGDLNSNDSNYIQYSSNPERMKKAIDSIDDYAPRNVEEFAKSYDQETHADLGQRWLKEYYFSNYGSGKNISDEHQIQVSADHKKVCIPEEDMDQFFTPVMEKEEAEAEKLAQIEFARKVTPEQLAKNIQKALDNMNEAVLDMEKRFFPLNQMLDRKKELAKALNVCRGDLEERNHVIFEKGDELKRRLPQYLSEIADDEIYRIFSEACQSQETVVSAYQSTQANAEGIRASETSNPSEEEHRAHLVQWIELRKGLDKILRKLDNEYTLASNLAKMLNQ